MDLEATLLEERSFPRRPRDGRLLIEPEGAGQSCELRRRRVKTIVGEMLDRSIRPLVRESVRFRSLETFIEKKRVIHDLETRLASDPQLCEELLRSRRRSHRDLERIGCYRIQSRDPGLTPLQDGLDAVTREFEMVRGDDGEPSLMPLHYALVVICKQWPECEPPPGGDELDRLERLLQRIQAEVDRRDRHGEIDATLLDVKRAAGLEAGP